MTRRACTFLAAVLWAAAAPAPVGLYGQRGAALPRPDSSRPPLLTAASAEAIRAQTANLHVMELEQALQAGDGPALARLLASATVSWGACGSVSQAVAAAATRVRRITRPDGRKSLGLFLDKIAIADSGTAQVVTAELVLMLASSSTSIGRSVTLAFDPERATWTREAGLLEGLCES